ncbi:hypothetical protein TSOC_011639 [Tetrabaena socialis]|uniref:Uncharacterized protein n=1 Tax=Tetrabaena socialis TaxID=47790 RepID=A0A2J7ZQ48_9CHLO|nr:hypothetical protein TSOC_011639 [Tetrabaena socialis]|eukprot:PNH02389.1 hypothetical protein TSOC_011639 [Tetrabaena socialis]
MAMQDVAVLVALLWPASTFLTHVDLFASRLPRDAEGVHDELQRACNARPPRTRSVLLSRRKKRAAAIAADVAAYEARVAEPCCGPKRLQPDKQAVSVVCSDGRITASPASPASQPPPPPHVQEVASRLQQLAEAHGVNMPGALVFVALQTGIDDVADKYHSLQLGWTKDTADAATYETLPPEFAPSQMRDYNGLRGGVLGKPRPRAGARGGGRFTDPEVLKALFYCYDTCSELEVYSEPIGRFDAGHMTWMAGFACILTNQTALATSGCNEPKRRQHMGNALGSPPEPALLYQTRNPDNTVMDNAVTAIITVLWGLAVSKLPFLEAYRLQQLAEAHGVNMPGALVFVALQTGIDDVADKYHSLQLGWTKDTADAATTRNPDNTVMDNAVTAIITVLWGLAVSKLPFLEAYRGSFLACKGEGVVLGETVTNLISHGATKF